MAAAQKTTAAPLPAKLGNLLREARWLALAGLAGYLLLIFLTFDRGDPGWSHSAVGTATHNAGGRAGAWIADLLLYLFGLSAYWWVALGLVGVARGYRALERSALVDRRPLAIALG
ncbi:MAG: DNA translocase FtsK 4TM domain-containing protein, partial [Burkholderiales bacterium]